MNLFRREMREEIRDEAQLEFERQSEVIRSLVREGPCIILGRCADQIFEEYPRALHIFIYASDQERIRNTMQMLHSQSLNSERRQSPRSLSKKVFLPSGG